MSAPLAGAEQYARARAEAEALVAAEPERVPDGHRLYRLRAHEAEFFQADPRGRHVRVRYTREGGAGGAGGGGGGGGEVAGGGWHRTLLWL
jgi:pyridoxamine 5'-phosphate oxidase